MPYSYPEIRRFDGLYLQANSFSDVPDGGLEEAENVVLSNDHKVFKKRGNYQYHDPGLDTAVSLFEFENKLIQVNTDSIGYFTDTGTAPNETGSKTTLTGDTVEVTTTDPSRATKFLGNLYFTTERGVYKIESYNGSVMTAGVPPALDCRGTLVSGSAIGTDPTNNTLVGYRVLFGRRDSDDVLYLGAPSDILQLSNPNASTTKDAELEFSVPSEIASTTPGWFYQVYRSSQKLAVTTSTTISLDFKLVKEQKLTSTEITRGVVYFTDSILDDFLGAELYTNPNSREGEAQANARPPKVKDVTLYKNHVIYAQSTSRHSLFLDIIDSTVIADTNYVEFQIGASQYRFVAETGAGNQSLAAVGSGTGTITVNLSGHGFQTGYEVYVSQITGTAPEGLYTITFINPNQFSISSPGNTATAMTIEGRTNGTDPIFYCDTTAGTVGVRNTAIGLIKAINRDSTSPFYGNYISTPSGVPGKIKIEAQGFGDPIEALASSSTVGGAFDPTLPTTYDDSVVSDNDDLPNGFFSSKISEPEAVPTTNFFVVGSKTKAIQRVVALRDSLIVIKEDGVYRVTGDTVSSFSITTLDNTVFCVAPKSVALINNQIIFLSNQGFCLVTESSVQIISRKIEDVITPIVGKSNIADETFGVAYESDRHYLVSTLLPNSSSAAVVYVYNILTNAWTTWTNTFDGGVVGPSDKLYLIESDGIVRRERKNHTKLDYTGQNYSTTIGTVAADGLSATATVGGGSVVPEVGDIIVKNNVVSRIISVSGTGPAYTIGFSRETNLEAADSVILYSHYDSKVKLVPFHGGSIGRSKHFSQFQLHLGSDDVSSLDISFTGSYFGGSTETPWKRSLIIEGGSGGWGEEPWGFFGWGMEDGINLTTSTQPANIVRTYIPRFQARSTFIQPVLEHGQAGERMNLQAITYTVRPYNERTTV